MKMRAFHSLMCLFVFVVKIISDTEATKPKSVNMALETVMEFNKEDAADLKLLNNVQQFIDKLKMVLGTNKTSRRFHDENKNIKFVDFIKSAIRILKTYDDNDLAGVFDIFDDELRKYHYRGCKFHELVRDQNLRRFVADKLNDIREKPAAQLRNILDNALQTINDAKYSGAQRELIDYVNSLYTPASNDKLIKFLKNLHYYNSKSKRANLDLTEIVRNGIRSIIFDHISELNPNVRRELKVKLETSWNVKKHPSRAREWTIKYPEPNSDTAKQNNDHSDMTQENSAAETVAANTTDTEVDVSEMSNEDEYFPTTSQKKLKSSHIHHHKGVANINYTSPKRHRSYYSKRSSFLTPKEIKMSTNKRSKVKKTKTAKLSTTLQENVNRKLKLKTDLPTSLDNEMKSSDYNESPEQTFISNHDTIINVERDGNSYKIHNHKNKSQRHNSKVITIPVRKHRTKSTKSLRKHRKQTHEKFNKHIQTDEGMSIERFAIERRSMNNTDRNQNSVQDDMKINVLRRINNLEKQMEEVKNKIDTKLTTVDESTSTVNETEFEPLEFWKGTTNKIENTPVSNNSSSQKSIKMDMISSTKTVKHSTTQHRKSRNENTTKSQEDFRRIDSNDIFNSNKSVSNKTDHVNDIVNNESENIVSKNESTVINDNKKLTTRLDEDLDKILRKYNISDALHSSTKMDINRYLAEAVTPDDVKAKEIKDIIESDLKKVMEMTAKPNDENELDDPFQDINAALDLM